ncbi:MAG: hypothetical protein G01um101448_979 [Parcubacteria group bacterium Gr01-1014_48]|nr:MAG: hypothetical protein Greene041614_1170 [Parcubacteria group bacterium Greene0416_14]TSC72387.1 MAG: hypothetical protein G01um101448_979 [Parcubacteria group bacterium Gr01-1014_48]TSC98989.1 MAG: hypothetical protein Greene101415_1204 [Parcubacteria group bacterium Greene1014_15]TSD06921.1 MAG: hypothetical protein Greene07144_1060 [Parcubacteria group bacterium Greene0714_4]
MSLPTFSDILEVLRGLGMPEAELALHQANYDFF